MGRYNSVYDRWRTDPEGFWMEAAQQIDWITPPTGALDDSTPPFYRWFADATCNTCHNAVDRHVEAGRGDQPAIIHDSPITDSQRILTYRELQTETAKLGGALQALGVTKGDRVLIYMPMTPEAVIAMLACARIGAVHSVVFGGFASNELAVRIDDCTPKAVIAASCGLEPNRTVPYKPLLDGAIDMADHTPDAVILKQRPQLTADMVPGRDHDWDTLTGDAAEAPCVPVGGADPLYILYTSGTTGKPKGVIRANAGHLVALNWSMKNIYNMDPGDVFWAASDVGWVVGHSYIVYAPLIAGCTTVLFEGKPVGTPDAGTFWRVIAEHDVKALFTAPTAIRAIRQVDPEGEFIAKHNLSGFHTLFLAGERADPATVEWAAEKLNVPVIDHWWQTETGWTIAGNPSGIELLDIPVGSAGVAMPGYDIRILDEGGNELPDGTLGAIAVKLPLPPGSLPTLWNADERFQSSYLTTFPGYYETGDAGMKENGTLKIMARTDDVINVAAHRLSTGEMEEALARHPDVAECAVIGVADELKGQSPVGLVCLKGGTNRPHEEIAAECVTRIRETIGPVAAFKKVGIVARLPKTRSGKILRATMVSIADDTPWNMPATIDDPAVLDEITATLKDLGYAKGA